MRTPAWACLPPRLLCALVLCAAGLCLLRLPAPALAGAESADDGAGDGFGPLKFEVDSRFPPPPEPAPPQRVELVLAFTGDNLLGARMPQLIEKHGEDWPYALVAEPLRAADLAFGNLECPITAHPHATSGKSAESIRAGRNFIFKAPPELSSRILVAAGYDVLSVANNHAMDYRGEGLLDTLAELSQAGIAAVGGGADAAQAAQPVVLEAAGWRVGYLAYSLIVPAASRADADSAGINTLAKEFSPALSKAIAALREQADIVVVSFHWGKESTSTPAAYQRDIGRAAIDAGADIVAGHHTHSLQGVELYHGGVIAYSLGNFLFTGKSRLIESLILRVSFSPDAAPENADSAAHPGLRVELLPVWVRGGRPETSTDERLIRHIASVCKSVGSTVELNDGVLLLSPAR